MSTHDVGTVTVPEMPEQFRLVQISVLSLYSESSSVTRIKDVISSILQESQPTKNRNLSRLISNLSLLNWSSQRNCVYCFSTLFTLLQEQEVLVNPVLVLV